jgi:hypothetical protein
MAPKAGDWSWKDRRRPRGRRLLVSTPATGVPPPCKVRLSPAKQLFHTAVPIPRDTKGDQVDPYKGWVDISSED